MTASPIKCCVTVCLRARSNLHGIIDLDHQAYSTQPVQAGRVEMLFVLVTVFSVLIGAEFRQATIYATMSTDHDIFNVTSIYEVR